MIKKNNITLLQDYITTINLDIAIPANGHVQRGTFYSLLPIMYQRKENTDIRSGDLT